jgi:hypothetical protein
VPVVGVDLELVVRVVGVVHRLAHVE